MGIDRHESEHRNYKPGRHATLARESDDPVPPNAEELKTEDAPLQPLMKADTAVKQPAKAPTKKPAKTSASKAPTK
jgi:hypothetical protein